MALMLPIFFLFNFQFLPQPKLPSVNNEAKCFLPRLRQRAWQCPRETRVRVCHSKQKQQQFLITRSFFKSLLHSGLPTTVLNNFLNLYSLVFVFYSMNYSLYTVFESGVLVIYFQSRCESISLTSLHTPSTYSDPEICLYITS